MTSSSPALVVSSRWGQAAKSSTAALGGGRTAQQPAEPLLGEDLGDAGAVERGVLGGQPGGDLKVDRPWRRSWITRPRARSLAGATPGGGPGLRGGANSSSFPARHSRTRLTIAQRV